MPSLLHLDSSANRPAESVSRRLTALFAQTWRSVHPAGEYRYRDLAADPVAPLESAFCALGRRVERTGASGFSGIEAHIAGEPEERAWGRTAPLITELLAADVVVIGAPMYNYCVSAALKAWIDRVSFPGMLFDAAGGALLAHTRIVIVSARGGAYGAGTPREAWDFQTPYLRAYFGKQGVPAGKVHIVTAEMTLAELVPRLAPLRASAAESLAAAHAQVLALARISARQNGAGPTPGSYQYPA